MFRKFSGNKASLFLSKMWLISYFFVYIYTCQKFTKKLVTLVTSGDMRCQPINDTKHKNNTCNIIKYLLLHLV